MDLLQVVLVFFILLLAVLLSVLGIQVFFILKDLKKSLEKLDKVLDDAGQIAEDAQGPMKIASDVSQAIEAGVRAVKAATSRSTEAVTSRVHSKPARRLFKRK
ncbi:MAG: hypothetical protein Q7S88_01625 [Candidatus Daviesbacteria bacterium]|nr:hypothetical protein [Candidatus Daviesbacteria bacterium]